MIRSAGHLSWLHTGMPIISFLGDTYSTKNIFLKMEMPHFGNFCNFQPKKGND
jgi:hypothetical protein